MTDSFQLSWSYYIQLLKIGDKSERNFYAMEAVQNNWAERELIWQYNSAIYERIALSGNKTPVKSILSDKINRQKQDRKLKSLLNL